MAEHLPTLSICVPTYNRPELLARALHSIVLAAGPSDGADGVVEIVVSDNSPDETEAIARTALAEWQGPARYVGNRPDLGMVGNFNQCVALAQGRYILLLHDDDALLPAAIPAILDGIGQAAPGARPLLFGVHVVDEVGGTRRRQEFSAVLDLSPRVALRRVLTDSSFVRFPAIVVPRECYEQAGPFDPGMGNAVDLDMWIRLFAQFGLRCLEPTISAYSVHAGASTASMFNRDSIATLMTIFERARATGVLTEATIRKSQTDFFHQFILGGAYRSLRSGDAAGARDVLALFKEPSVRALGRSVRWMPVRVALSVLVHSPGIVCRAIIGLIERFNVAQRVWMTR